MLVNLCINARDAIDVSGEIVISVKTLELNGLSCNACQENISGKYVSLSVTDSGEGISKEDQDSIFKPFFTTKELGKGTGMGLAIINTIIHSCDGHIHLESEISRGTTFDILFPIQTH